MDFIGWHFAQTKLRGAKVGHTFDAYCFCCALCKQFSTIAIRETVCHYHYSHEYTTNSLIGDELKLPLKREVGVFRES